jgi:hypothetical protein
VQDFYNFLAVPTAGSAAFGFLSLMMVNGDFNARQRYAYI